MEDEKIKYYAPKEVMEMAKVSYRVVQYLSDQYPDIFKHIKFAKRRVFKTSGLYIFLLYQDLLNKGFHKKDIIQNILAKVALETSPHKSTGILIVGQEALIVKKMDDPVEVIHPKDYNVSYIDFDSLIESVS